MDDFDALEAAGIANARERAGLIKYLDSLGFTVEEMAEAESRGRLFGLAGDVLQWSGRPTYSPRTAAEGSLGFLRVLGSAMARLVGAAAPGQILATSAVRDELQGWPATVQDPLSLKGFDAPVAAYELHGTR